MARIIQSVPEMYTDHVVDQGGGAREVYWWIRVIFQGEDPAGEWHFYGTEPDPEKYPNAIRHPPTHFPTMFNLCTEGGTGGLFFDLAVDAERNALEA